jgi:hypothetical protein
VLFDAATSWIVTRCAHHRTHNHLDRTLAYIERLAPGRTLS